MAIKKSEKAPLKTHTPVDSNDFCREWEITDPGEGAPWLDQVKVGARFVIVRSGSEFRFIPIIGFGEKLSKQSLSFLKAGAYGQFGTCESLEGALQGDFFGVTVLFTLNTCGNRFVVSLSKDSAPDPELQISSHGGPHGTDN